MAENKKSFVLYSDNYGLIKQLPDEIAGRLFKHIFSYVNDENPISEDLLLNIAFEPIKMQLKRDLNKWQESKDLKSDNGRLGNLKRWNLDLYNEYKSGKITIEQAEEIAKHRKASQGDKNNRNTIAKIAVNVNDNVSVNVNDNVLKDNIPEIKNFGDVVIEDFNSSHAEILKNESHSWLESVSMQQKIQINEIKNKIDQFVLFLSTTQTQHKSKKAFLEHFINWLTKKNNSQKNGTEQNSFGGKQQFRFSTDNAIQTIIGDS